MNEQEIWVPIPNYDGYEVSNLGRVRFISYLSPTKAKSGAKSTGGQRYPHLQLSKDGKAKTFKLHYLVAEAFLGPRPAGYTVDHLDFNRDNNRASNLEYVTIDENIQRAIDAGMMSTRVKSHTCREQFRLKLTEANVAEIKSLLAEPDCNMTAIGKAYGVSRETIRQIKIGKMWAV